MGRRNPYLLSLFHSCIVMMEGFNGSREYLNGFSTNHFSTWNLKIHACVQT